MKSKVPKGKRVVVEKADHLYEKSLEAEKKGDLAQALNHIRFAVLYDPRNPIIRKKLAELNTKFKSSSAASDPKKNEAQSEAQEKEIFKGRNIDWTKE